METYAELCDRQNMTNMPLLPRRVNTGEPLDNYYAALCRYASDPSKHGVRWINGGMSGFMEGVGHFNYRVTDPQLIAIDDNPHIVFSNTHVTQYDPAVHTVHDRVTLEVRSLVVSELIITRLYLTAEELCVRTWRLALFDDNNAPVPQLVDNPDHADLIDRCLGA